MNGPAVSPRSPRFRTIDGLRGIAAAAVAVFHFNLAVERSAPHWLPEWLSALAQQGALGVDIFFVISGFVIAFSVRDGKYTPRYLGLFALRRSIRLDPPYWVTIALELVLIAVSVRLFPSLRTPFPSVGMILAHLIYAQDILRYGHILSIFWTLCFEIQFYLMFIGLLVLWEPLRQRLSPDAGKALSTIGLAALFVVSVLMQGGVVRFPIHGLALQRWFEFFLGVLTWWAVSDGISILVVAAAYLAIGASVMFLHFEAWTLLPVVVSAFILGVAKARKLETMLNGATLQFLGKISYSLYLIHGPVGERCVSLIERLAGNSFGVGWAIIAFASASAVSLAAATLLWRLVEVPTMRLSKRVRLESRVEEPTPPTESVPSLATT